ncbi:MAG: hypothetical protein ABIE94_06500 [archaeon]
MTPSTTEQTIEYIKEHPHIKNCLKKGLINYSSLARLISKELKIEKTSSKEAILIAARRFQEKLKKELDNENKIRTLLSESEIEIKNKISVLILNKLINMDCIIEFQKNVNKENGTLYVLEGTDNYTLITQEKYAQKLLKKFKNSVIRFHKDLAIIDFKSPEEIEEIIGVLSYLTSLFAENGVNIIEFLSCWRDTIFVIDKNDVNKAITFLNF